MQTQLQKEEVYVFSENKCQVDYKIFLKVCLSKTETFSLISHSPHT